MIIENIDSERNSDISRCQRHWFFHLDRLYWTTCIPSKRKCNLYRLEYITWTAPPDVGERISTKWKSKRFHANRWSYNYNAADIQGNTPHTAGAIFPVPGRVKAVYHLTTAAVNEIQLAPGWCRVAVFSLTDQPLAHSNLMLKFSVRANLARTQNAAITGLALDSSCLVVQ